MEAHQSCIAACWLVKGLFHFDDRCHKITNHCHKITDNIFVLILPSFDSKSVRYVSNFRTFIECFSESFTLRFHFSIRFPAFCDHFVCLFVSFLSAFVAFLPAFLPVQLPRVEGPLLALLSAFLKIRNLRQITTTYTSRDW